MPYLSRNCIGKYANAARQIHTILETGVVSYARHGRAIRKTYDLFHQAAVYAHNLGLDEEPHPDGLETRAGQDEKFNLAKQVLDDALGPRELPLIEELVEMYELIGGLEAGSMRIAPQEKIRSAKKIMEALYAHSNGKL